jgi:hypothetical protein
MALAEVHSQHHREHSSGPSSLFGESFSLSGGAHGTVGVRTSARSQLRSAGCGRRRRRAQSLLRNSRTPAPARSLTTRTVHSHRGKRQQLFMVAASCEFCAGEISGRRLKLSTSSNSQEEAWQPRKVFRMDASKCIKISAERCLIPSWLRIERFQVLLCCSQASRTDASLAAQRQFTGSRVMLRLENLKE